MALAAVVDISGRKRAESQRELLLAELNHRVKNTLAVVQGIAHQTFKDTDAGARNAFEGRLVALAVAHNLLTQANWENASLEQLASDTLQVSGPNSQRVSLSGPRILLPPRQALAIAMAMHELCINAVKYGALSNDSGRIALEWSRTPDPQGRLNSCGANMAARRCRRLRAAASARCCLNAPLPGISRARCPWNSSRTGSCARSMRRCRRRRGFASERAGRQEDTRWSRMRLWSWR
jgi:two-component sensor histidine kinase